MNILITLDKNYLYPLTVLLKSITVSNPDGNFDIYIAHPNLDKNDFNNLEKYIDMSRMTIHPVKINSSLFKDAPYKKRLTEVTYYRLLATEFLPEDMDKILYLDPDICVINPLDSLYDTDMQGYSMAAAGHTWSWVEWLNKVRYDFKDDVRYINAGIILMNLEEMRKKYTSRDIFEYIEKNKHLIFVGDQDVINGMYNKSMKIVDERIYNLDENTFKRFRNEIDLDWVKRNTVIVHYNGKYKPWKAEYKGELKDFFDKIAGMRLDKVLAND